MTTDAAPALPDKPLDPRHLQAMMQMEMAMAQARAESERTRTFTVTVLYTVVGTLVGLLVALYLMPMVYTVLPWPVTLPIVIACAALGGWFGSRRAGNG